MSRKADPTRIAEVGRCSERWRFDAEDCIQARKATVLAERDELHDAVFMGLNPAKAAEKFRSTVATSRRLRRRPPGSTTAISDFAFVPRSFIGEFNDWQTVLKGRWSGREGIIRTEGRAAVMALRHALRSLAGHGKRQLLLCDNLGLVLSLGKGRAHTVPLSTRPAAKSAACHCCPAHVWSRDGSRQNGITAIAPREPARPPAQPRLRAMLRRSDARKAPPSARPPARGALLGSQRGSRQGKGLSRSTPSGTPSTTTSSTPGTTRPAAPPPPAPSPSSGLVRSPLLGGTPPTTARSARATRRVATHPCQPLQGQPQALSTLERGTVRPTTEKRYLGLAADFADWTGNPQWDLLPVEKIDLMIVEYLEELFYAGYNCNTGEQIVASLIYSSPMLSRLGKASLPRGARALRGFRKLAPGASRAPLPWVGVAAMIGAAFNTGQERFALALLIQFIAYLRPAEVLKIEAQHVVAPVSGSGVRWWGLLLSPEEEGRPGKTGQTDESLLLDWPETPSLGARLDELRKAAKPGTGLFGLDHKTFNQKFYQAAELTGVHVLHPHPYAVRHGGASFDSLHRRRPPLGIMQRGRWRVEASVRRYDKHTRVLREVEKLGEATCEYGNRIIRDLDEILGRRVQAPPPPATLCLGGTKRAAPATPQRPSTRRARLQ